MSTENDHPTFASFGLAAEINQAIADSGYTQPTPIQQQAIPVLLAGRDVMGAAQTGTGKTAAFTLPIIERLLPLASGSASPARHPVRALILTPTRELADQVAENFAKYARHTPLRSVVVFGGVDMTPQTAALRRGVEVLIATPGRLLDHIQQKNCSLSQVQILVLDEADRMLDMGFLPDLQRILNLLPEVRQTLLFSATFSPEIRKLAASYLRDPLTIEVARQNSTADNVSQVVYLMPESRKRAAILHLLDERTAQGRSRQCIIFCNSKIGCSKLSRALEKDGVSAGAIHGDKTQTERMQTLDGFKKGDIDVLVATDVAARGLDIQDMPCVINFDLPFSAEDYVHRIGRTGRAGASGEAISLFSHGDERLLAEIEKLIRRPLRPGVLPGFDVAEENTDAGRPARGADRSDETERAPRERHRRSDDRESGAARPPRARDSARFFDASSPPRGTPRIKDDPFFSRPYEPSPSALSSDVPDAPIDRAPLGPAKRPLAALLGGVSRKG